MRFGTCVGFDKLESAAKLGYDYLESNLGHIKSLSEQELKETKAMLDGYGAKLEAANCFFPGEIHLAGEDADIEIIRDYTRRAFDNAVFLGIKTCVLGSGRSRSVQPLTSARRNSSIFMPAASHLLFSWMYSFSVNRTVTCFCRFNICFLLSGS